MRARGHLQSRHPNPVWQPEPGPCIRSLGRQVDDVGEDSDDIARRLAGLLFSFLLQLGGRNVFDQSPSNRLRIDAQNAILEGLAL